MGEQAEELVCEMTAGHERKKNSGWFRSGDARINREGRPRGSKVSKEFVADLALQSDRVKLFFVPGQDLAIRLSRQNAPWVVNLPPDVEIVGSRVDVVRNGLVLTIRSAAFPRIAKGATIPEFVPEFNGLRWKRN